MGIHREPSAWVNAAKMDSSYTGYYLYVEGGSDERFWKKFIIKDRVKIRVCNGWNKVVTTVQLHNDASLTNCLGIIDRDFRLITKENINCNNVFETDLHDIEMMMFCSNAYDNIINSIDRYNKIEKCEASGCNLLQNTLSITDIIGCLKISNMLNSLGLIFKKEDKHEIKQPKYEDIIDRDGNYLGNDSLINKVYGFTTTYSTPKCTKNDIKKILHPINQNRHDSRHLSNGHDVSIILTQLINKKCKISPRQTAENIETLLLCAYHIDDFKLTQLYKDIKNWEGENNDKILID